MGENHLNQWLAVKSAVSNKRFPQAWFFIGPLHCNIPLFALQSIQLLLCAMRTENGPCLNCIDCTLVGRTEHPDVHWVKPEKSGSAIKVEQIRELQNSAFLTRQRATSKVIVIEYADKMNSSAANALLKILEEPSKDTHFILIAEQVSMVLPTIFSRCQLLHFSTNEDLENVLELGSYYPESAERAVLVNQSETLIQALIDVIQRKQHPCAVASQWSQFELSNVLWFLYLIYAQVSYLNIHAIQREGIAHAQLIKLEALTNPILIFEQIDRINKILKKLSHNININPLLVLEDLFFSLMKSGSKNTSLEGGEQ